MAKGKKGMVIKGVSEHKGKKGKKRRSKKGGKKGHK
jgi:hypothetical protein